LVALALALEVEDLAFRLVVVFDIFSKENLSLNLGDPGTNNIL